MIKKPLLLMFVMSLFIISNVHALSWSPICLNSTHLYEYANLGINGTIYTFNQTTYCPTGCSDSLQSCSPSALETNFLFIFLIGIILIMIIASMKLPFVLGLPILFIDMVFTLYFMVMTDFFSTAIMTILSAMVVMEILFAFYIMRERTKDED